MTTDTVMRKIAGLLLKGYDVEFTSPSCHFDGVIVSVIDDGPNRRGRLRRIASRAVTRLELANCNGGVDFLIVDKLKRLEEELDK